AAFISSVVWTSCAEISTWMAQGISVNSIPPSRWGCLSASTWSRPSPTYTSTPSPSLLTPRNMATSTQKRLHIMPSN
ncbi:hypothetical protein N7481_011892, partial [Penicillium waksmanii]|uniref:uncharacterized protein n=1 Tax=Penicillium waksmanii TaxID=69791 RepID=UPI002549AC7A